MRETPYLFQDGTILQKKAWKECEVPLFRAERYAIFSLSHLKQRPKLIFSCLREILRAFSKQYILWVQLITVLW